MLNVVDVQVTYGGAVTGVESATVDVAAGEVVALLGANGAGKSSLLRAVGGLLAFHRGQVAAGRIEVDGTRLGGRDATQAARLGVASSLEGRRLFGDLSVAENLRLGGFRRGREAGGETDRVLALFPRLAERAGQPAAVLSGGEQQMLAIGRALMAAPRLLLLDEPSLGLAPKIVTEIGTAIREVARQGTAVLLADQNIALATTASDRTYVMSRGRVGPGDQGLDVAAVLAGYLGTSDHSDREEVGDAAPARA